jgi:hypothetical protein
MIDTTPEIGTQVYIAFESVRVLCIVKDSKTAYGRKRIQVQPVNGTGLQWVALDRLNCLK